MPNDYITRENATAELLKLLNPGDTVYTILRHVSSSGMLRRISCVIPVIDDNGRTVIRSLDHLVSAATHYRLDKRDEGLRIGGAGMDMGFAIVYDLGKSLWPNGTPQPHGHRNGEPDSAGGYALRHRWL